MKCIHTTNYKPLMKTLPIKLKKTFEANWRDKHFAKQEDTILLAVSGGADSMVMAHLFLNAAIPFAIAHCNFQLRGAEADGDEQLVKGWAAANGIPFHNIRFNTRQVAAEQKTSIQEAARMLRYTWLEEIKQQHTYAAIATAHHANDNAETLLINFFKGTGISGLHGIPEKNGNIIRPMLFATRQEIEQYSAENNIAYRNDSSNTSDKYLRNAVRHNILPVINGYFPSVVGNLNENIERFKQVETVYKTAIQKQIKKLTERRGVDVFIPTLKLAKASPLATICYELFSAYDFTSAQVPHIIELIDAESGKFMETEHYKLIKDRNFLIITKKDGRETDNILIDSFPAKIATRDTVFSFATAANHSFSKDETTATIDFDKLELPLLLRKWKAGDYFYPLGMNMKKKKIARFLIDQKIPLHQKEKVWVLESRKKIIWVAGMRLDERFKLTASSKNILKVEMKPV